jgi:hypothetical protein
LLHISTSYWGLNFDMRSASIRSAHTKSLSQSRPSTGPYSVLANVSVRVTLSAVDEKSKRRIVGVVEARDLNQRTWFALAAVRDLDLCTFEVELGIAALGAMDGNMFDAHKILSRGCVARNGELHLSLIPRAPVGIGETTVRTAADDLLVDLEPVSISLVLAYITGSLRHVYSQWARVFHCGIVPQFKSERVSSIELGNFGLACVVEGTRVAAEVIAGGFEWFGRHDSIAVLTNELKVSGELSVDDGFAEAIMSFSRLRRCKTP